MQKSSRVWSVRLGFVQRVSLVGILGFVAWIATNVFVLGQNAQWYMIVGFDLLGVVAIGIEWLTAKKKLDRSAIDEGWEQAEHLLSSPKNLAISIFKRHQATFPKHIHQKGALGRDVAAPQRQRGQGRQGHASRRKAGSGKSSSSSDSGSDGGGDGGDGEPPRSSIQHLFLSFFDLAIRWSCAEKTLRNQVSCGKLPRPVQLPVGPRFPISLVEQIERGEWQSQSTVSRTTLQAKSLQSPPARGRPRIAVHGKGGAA